MTADEPRHISGLLMIGLVSVPIVFVWLLLRRGYAGSTRTAAFTYALFGPALGLVVALGRGAGF